MDYDNWEKVVKLVAPGIRIIKVSNVYFFFLFYYLSI